MEKKGYQEEMEQWQKDLEAAREHVSIGFSQIIVLFSRSSNNRSHCSINRQFRMELFGRNVVVFRSLQMKGLLSLNLHCVLFQGFDVKGDDPREIVQNIVFGSQYEGCRDEMKLVSLVPPPIFFSGYVASATC